MGSLKTKNERVGAPSPWGKTIPRGEEKNSQQHPGFALPGVATLTGEP